MASWIARLLLLTLPLVSLASTQSCYLPNGTVIGGLRVCNPTAEFSHCCAPGDECTTNGFCKAGTDRGNNFLWRPTCTDQSWGSSLCPKYCYNSSTAPGASGVFWRVLACSPDQYCCGYEGETYDPAAFQFDCCTDTLRLFNAGPAEHLAGATYTTSIFAGFTSVSTQSSSSPTSTLASTTTTTTATSSSMSSSSPASSVSATPATTTAAASNAGLSTGTQAGIGVGVAVGAIALIAVGILVALRMIKPRTSGARTQPEDDQEIEHAMPPKYEKPAAVEADGWEFPAEADSNVRAELEDNSMLGWRRTLGYSRSTK